MSQHNDNRQSGVSLVEIILQLALVCVFVVMGMAYWKHRETNQRIDKTAMQMQQILNVSMAYYVTNGAWPNDIPTLTSAHFFSSDPVSPWASQSYYIGQDAKRENLYVWTEIDMKKPGTAASYAHDIAGQLPFGYMGDGDDAVPGSGGTIGTPPTENTCSGTTCTVAASITAPERNQNNAGIIYGGLYHPGACVPVPICPSDSATTPVAPTVFIVPASISGASDDAAGASDVYQMSNFTGYATGGDDMSPPACQGSAPDSQQDCSQNSNAPPSQKYWRACAMQINGGTSGNNNGVQYVTLMSLTRCSGDNE